MHVRNARYTCKYHNLVYSASEGTGEGEGRGEKRSLFLSVRLFRNVVPESEDEIYFRARLTAEIVEIKIK